MTQTHTAASSSSPAPLRSRLGTLAVIPWAGEHQEDGADMAFLLAYSLGDGVDGPEGGQAAVTAVAEELGLPLGGAILDVARTAKMPVRLLVEAGAAVLTMPPHLHATCPVPAQWTAAAYARGAVYVVLAARPWPQAVPGRPLPEDALRHFAADPEVLASAAHCLVPVTTLG